MNIGQEREIGHVPELVFGPWPVYWFVGAEGALSS